MQLFDSHAHYNDEQFDEDRNMLIENIFENGVTRIINAGYSVASSKKAIEIANIYDNMYATCGISPNDVDNIDIQSSLNEIEMLAKNKKVVAIGEIGLDYYWNKDNKDLQRMFFKEQIKIANQLNLPIVIHTREAIMDTISMIKNEIEVKKRGVFHCCPHNIELIKEALKLDFNISFAGPVTFKNSKNANQVIEFVPLNKILIETDSPYLSPEPNRGKRNDSRNLLYIVEKIASIKQISIEEVANQTYENACKLFGIENRSRI